MEAEAIAAAAPEAQDAAAASGEAPTVAERE